MRSLVVTVFALAGCKTLLGIDDGVVAGNADAAVDDAPIADDANDAALIDAPDSGLGWWDPTFMYRRSITLDTTALALPLANLPVFVRIPPDVRADLATNNVDARFVADDQLTVLPFEIESNDTSTHAWVKVSLITPNPRIWLYFGNAFAASQSSGAAVFAAEYESVHHLANGTDATGHGHNAVATPGTATPTTVDAIVGRGVRFDGVNDYISLTSGDAPFDFTTQMSVSAWVRTANFDVEWQAIVTKGDSAWRVQRANTQSYLTFATGFDIATDNVVGTSTIDNDAWHHVLVTSDANTKSLYIDGVLEGTRNNPPPIPTNGNAVRIGSNEQAAGRTWNGPIDEVRISATPRSAAWAKAEYVMITSSTFSTFGARETRP